MNRTRLGRAMAHKGVTDALGLHGSSLGHDHQIDGTETVSCYKLDPNSTNLNNRRVDVSESCIKRFHTT